MPDLEDVLDLHRSMSGFYTKRFYLVLVEDDPEPFFFLDPRTPADFFEPGTYSITRLPT